MKAGAILAVAAATGGIGLGVYGFISNASPYVSAKEAAARPGSVVRISGKIVHENVRVTPQTLEFDLIDEKGDKLPVVFKGMKPANFDSAPKASLGGRYKDGRFYADTIMTQCPSKYESEKTNYLPRR